jgi:predicted ribosome quality control (RQC) complex YloA/Tae2 family protein
MIFSSNLKEVDEIYTQKVKIKYGKNAKENWNLIDESSSDDLWFHIDDYPSTHVLLEYNLDEEDRIEEYIEKAVQLCVEKTPKIKSYIPKIKSVKVIYTKVENIKKGKSVGEVIILNHKLVKYKVVKIN